MYRVFRYNYCSCTKLILTDHAQAIGFDEFRGWIDEMTVEAEYVEPKVMEV